MISSHIISAKSLINADNEKLINQFVDTNPSIKEASTFLIKEFLIDLDIYPLEEGPAIKKEIEE